ncbi:hypothetical protein MASR1M66_22620 [Aminivibrio sp.]
MQIKPEELAAVISPQKTAEINTKKQPVEDTRHFVREDQVKEAVLQANKLAVVFDRSLKYEYRREADVYQVSVIDTSKDEVVRKIPSDEIVRFIANIKELFGALLDVHA